MLIWHWEQNVQTRTAESLGSLTRKFRDENDLREVLTSQFHWSPESVDTLLSTNYFENEYCVCRIERVDKVVNT